MCNMHGNRTKVKYTKFLCYVLIDLGDKMKETSEKMKEFGWKGTSSDITNILSGRLPLQYKGFVLHLKTYLKNKGLWAKYQESFSLLLNQS